MMRVQNWAPMAAVVLWLGGCTFVVKADEIVRADSEATEDDLGTHDGSFVEDGNAPGDAADAEETTDVDDAEDGFKVFVPKECTLHAVFQKKLTKYCVEMCTTGGFELRFHASGKARWTVSGVPDCFGLLPDPTKPVDGTEVTYAVTLNPHADVVVRSRCVEAVRILGGEDSCLNALKEDGRFEAKLVVNATSREGGDSANKPLDFIFEAHPDATDCPKNAPTVCEPEPP